MYNMQNIKGIDQIYVLHHKPFKDRGEVIFKRLQDENIDYELVTHYSPEEIGDKYEWYLWGWEQHHDMLIENPMQNYQSFSRKVSIGSLSLILKHLYCFTKQDTLELNNILIIEDDCNIPENFTAYLQETINDYLKLQKTVPVEICMIGTSFGMKASNYENDPIKPINYGCAYQHPIFKTRCTHAYIVSLSGARKLLQNFQPINNPIDFRLNEIMQFTGMKVAWREPGLQQNDGK
jgi:GR25 family glycosyltransferase involved in LPS biosynthesis